MSTRSTTKTKKPTQPTISPKQWKVIETQLKYLTGRVEQVGVLANNVAEISDRVADCRRELASALESPKPQEQKPWVPTEGEIVFVKSCMGVIDSPGAGRLISVAKSVNQYCVNDTRNGQCTVTLDQLRQATYAEIDTYLEAEEQRKKKEDARLAAERKAKEANGKKRAARLALDEAKARLVDLQMYAHAKVIRDMQREQFPD